MAQPHGRGHASYTYDISSVIRVDHDLLAVTVAAEHSVAPVTHQLITRQRQLSPGSRPPIVSQIFQACVDSIEVRGRGGRWSSAKSLQAGLRYSGEMLDEFISFGYLTLEDPELDLVRMREVVASASWNDKRRTVSWVAARAVESTDRPDARTIALRLRHTSFPAHEQGEGNPYTDTEVEVLREAARVVLDDIYESHRAVFDSLGFPTAARAWWNVNAEEAIAAARARDVLRSVPLKGRSLPLGPVSWDDDEIVDWLLLNPTEVPSGARSIEARGSRFSRLHYGVYFPEHGIVAATILHCLLENRGYNFATLVNTGCDDLIDTGGGTGVLRTAKARNHTVTRDGVFYGGRYSSTGGLLLLVKALTRFARHCRSEALTELSALDPTISVGLADKFYAPFRADVTEVRLFEPKDGSLPSGPFARVLSEVAHRTGIDPPGVRYLALRHYALYAGLRFDPDHDVVGHSPRTRVDYLARCLPEATLHELGAGTQMEMHDNALRSFLGTDDGRKLVQAVEDRTAADMVANLCTSNLMDPERGDKPCSLGLAACFTCPNGYRTKDHVPGLLALQEFTERIGAVNPDEWTNGEAGLLHAYATKSLAKFPPALVNAQRDHAEHENLIAIVAHLYTEFRRA